MKEKTNPRVQKDPKVRSFFILAFPSVVVIILAMWFTVDVKTSVVMMILAIYQFLLLKQFVDQYHEVL